MRTETTGVVARELGIGRTTLRDWCEQGCPFEWADNNRYRVFDTSEVRAWKEARDKDRAERKVSIKREREQKRLFADRLAVICWSLDRDKVARRLRRLPLEELVRLVEWWEKMTA